MRICTLLGVLFGLAMGLVGPAVAKTVCISPRMIDHTRVLDPGTVLLHMTNGKVYRSHLTTPCLGARFYGFSYVGHARKICGGMTAINVSKTREACTLGPLELEIIGRH